MFLKRVSLIVILILIAVVAFFGRIRYSSWKTIQEDSPLCAKGRIAVSKSRVGYPPFFVPAVEWTEYAWDTGHHLLRRDSIVEEIDEYLYKIGYINQLHDVVGCINDIDTRIAPYRFFIVSLEPTIVVMTDYDYGNIENKAIIELVGQLNDQYIHYSKYLVNAYHYGSSVPKMANYKWFAPKYTKDIQDVIQDNGKFLIKTKIATLTFGEDERNGWYPITRQ